MCGACLLAHAPPLPPSREHKTRVRPQTRSTHPIGRWSAFVFLLECGHHSLQLGMRRVPCCQCWQRRVCLVLSAWRNSRSTLGCCSRLRSRGCAARIGGICSGAVAVWWRLRGRGWRLLGCICLGVEGRCWWRARRGRCFFRRYPRAKGRRGRRARRGRRLLRRSACIERGRGRRTWRGGCLFRRYSRVERGWWWGSCGVQACEP